MCEGCAWYHEGWLMNCQYYCVNPTECEPTLLGWIVITIGIAFLVFWLTPIIQGWVGCSKK